MSNIQLLEHQRKPVEYLAARCKKQHGLIVNHYMGTGKTITGLTFLKNYPKDKKVIIVPKGLESIWVNETVKFDIKNITFINFDELKFFERYRKTIANSICVIDEAHNLYDITDGLTESFEDNKGARRDNKHEVIIVPELISFIDLIHSTKKLLLMTGTLMKNNNIRQIRWLINLAAGKGIVPYDEIEFYYKYMHLSVVDKAYLQVFRPFFKANPFNIFPRKDIKDLPLDENNVMDFIFAIVSSKAMFALVDKKIKGAILHSDKGIIDIERYKELLTQSKKLFSPKMLAHTLLITLLTKGIILVFSYIRSYYKQNYDFDRFDVGKLMRDNVNRYFSYFNYKYIDSKDYPSMKEKIIRVKYTDKQMLLLLKVIGIPENLENSEYVDLELNKNIREAELFKNPYDIKSKFMNKGRIIGNLYEDPIKFKQIIDIYKANKQEQTVIYSNFYESGILLFSKYLKVNKIKHSILNQDMTSTEKNNVLLRFKNKKIKLLLLHPDFYQGINIIGCLHFHILEPVAGSEKRDQLYARVIRYKSHAHLAKKKQNVNIYQWVCTLKYDISKVLHTTEYIKEWGRSLNPYKTVLDIMDVFKDKLSPDDSIIEHYNKASSFVKEFSKTIEHISIDKSTIPLNCCIWTPDDSCSDKKLKSCIE